MFWYFYLKPTYGEIYNAGGGRKNSISILETIALVNKINKGKWNNFVIKKKPRIGDHIWYITNFSKFQKKFKKWKIKYNIKKIIQQLIQENTK